MRKACHFPLLPTTSACKLQVNTELSQQNCPAPSPRSPRNILFSFYIVPSEAYMVTKCIIQWFCIICRTYDMHPYIRLGPVISVPDFSQVIVCVRLPFTRVWRCCLEAMWQGSRIFLIFFGLLGKNLRWVTFSSSRYISYVQEITFIAMLWINS